ncbi:phosphatidate cytidylyltransferase [Plantactinospora sp. GCM10030261]|uniref:phosphatidate cytidylyltransferase n=1 Tax=Plantactinospora sp. GCM10030261 TaxID=3273420 RepID=UPI0036077DA1
MSYLDPYGSTEPRGWEPSEGPLGRVWPPADGAPDRARHAGAAPDAYAGAPTAEPVADQPASWPGDNGRPGSAYPDRHGRVDPARYPPEEAGGPAALTDPIGLPPVVVPSSGSPHLAFPGGPPVEPAPGQGGPVPANGRPADREWPGPAPAAPAREVGAGPDRPPGHRGRRRATRTGKPAGSSRAGRNLPAAIGVGLALGAAILLSLFLWRPAFLGVIAVAVAVGIWELVRAVSASGARPPLVPLLAGGLLMVGLAWFSGPDALSLGLLVTVLATLVWRLGDGPAGYQRDVTAATLTAVYVPFLGGFAALLTAAPDGDFRVLATLAAVVLSDTGGYIAGVWLGKHPMAPSVSPKKSWEGFGGSVVAAAGGTALLLWLTLDVAPVWGALTGLAVACAAVLGDLGESMIKRDLGIKDMSNLLPGHGGLMDRLDSILFALPVAYLLLSVFAPAS